MAALDDHETREKQPYQEVHKFNNNNKINRRDLTYFFFYAERNMLLDKKN